MNPYVPIALVIFISVGFGVVLSFFSWFFGPKSYHPAKHETYECGVPLVTSAREKNSVRFYLTAIIFILFDIETVFLFLWAKNFRELGFAGLLEVGIFITVLLAAYIYLLKRGAFEWD